MSESSARMARGRRIVRKVIPLLHEPFARLPRAGFSTEAVQTRARVNVTCVTPLGEEVASTS